VLSRIKMNKLEYRGVIKFLIKQRKAAKIIGEEMLALYGDVYSSKSTVCKWSKLLKHGLESLDDDLRPGRPVDAITSNVIEKNQVFGTGRSKIKEVTISTFIRSFRNHGFQNSRQVAWNEKS
jgi:hypothetical protein